MGLGKASKLSLTGTAMITFVFVVRRLKRLVDYHSTLLVH